MKKIFVITLFSGFCFGATAQSLDIGLKGGIASTWLLNENVSNAGTDQDYVSSVSPEYGLHLELNFIGGTGIVTELMYSDYTQNYKGVFHDPIDILIQNGKQNITKQDETMTSKNELSLIKIPLLFHYEATSGLSIEVGPEYAMISSATFSANYTGEPLLSPSSVSYTSTNSYNTGNLLAVIGFGWNIKLTPAGNWGIYTDLRFEYSLTDLVGTDAHGESLTNSSSNPLYTKNSIGTFYYNTYAPTHLLEGSFSVGVYYRINFAAPVKGKM